MNYPVDQMQLKTLLLANSDLAVEWFDDRCLPYVNRTIRRCFWGDQVKSKLDVPQIQNDVRLNFWLRSLPVYEITRCSQLQLWAQFCSKRFIYTKAKQHMSRGNFFNKFLTLTDTSLRDDPKNDWLETYMSEIDDEKKYQMQIKEKLDEVVFGLDYVATKKERKILNALIYFYIERPDLIDQIGKAPMTQIAKKVGLPVKAIDNGIQRIRKKLRHLEEQSE